MKTWRTTTVVELCQAMRETKDYSAAGILADALEEAGCDDGDMVAMLRLCHLQLDSIEAERLVALAYSEETAAAVRTIERFAEELGPRAFHEEGDGYGNEKPTDYGRMYRVAERWTTDPDGWGYTVEHGSDNLRDDWNALGFADFWEAYRVLTGKAGEGNPFSCTC